VLSLQPLAGETLQEIVCWYDQRGKIIEVSVVDPDDKDSKSKNSNWLIYWVITLLS
jgi:hypothetical protein